MPAPTRRAARTGLLLAVLALVVACERPQTSPASIEVTDPDAAVILRARELLEDPVEALATNTEALVAEVDAVRHEVARGASQAARIQEARAQAEALRAESEAVLQLPRQLADEPVHQARAPVARLATTAREVADLAESDLAELEPLAQADQAMDVLVTTWDAPGSRDARRRALTEAVDRADEVVAQTAALPAGPCPGLQENRVRWAAVVADRSRQLLAAVEERDGDRFDALRVRYTLAPYGEDRVAADAAHRPCWVRQADVVARSGRIPDLLQQVADSLDG